MEVFTQSGIELLMAKLVRWLKKLWLRAVARNLNYADAHASFQVLYAVSDPWDMVSQRQQRRFRLTNEIIQKEFGSIGSLLEIGCGEGYQTDWLSRLCRSVHAFDVSSTAIQRARQRKLPQATFMVSDFLGFQPPNAADKYDLVVGCEVFYYVSDVAAAIRKLTELGDQFLVTYRFPDCPRMDPWFAAIPGVRTQMLMDGSPESSGWKAVWRTQNTPATQAQGWDKGHTNIAPGSACNEGSP